MWSARASTTTTSPPARPTAAKKVAATTRSGMTRCAWVRVQLLDPLHLDLRRPRPA